MDREYDVALSFAGDARDVARGVADLLPESLVVFLDERERNEMWGSLLTDALPQRYAAAGCCVLLLSDHYFDRVWPTLERRAIISSLHDNPSRKVLAIRLRRCTIEPDPSELPIEAQRVEDDDEVGGIAALILAVIGSPAAPNGTSESERAI